MSAEILTDERLDQIEARAAAATTGEWSVPHLSSGTCKCNCGHVLSEGYFGAIATINVDNGRKFEDGGNDGPPLAEAKANGIFIAYAKNFDIPDLITEVRRLRGVFEAAAHGPFCRRHCGYEPTPCDCWKSKAVAK